MLRRQIRFAAAWIAAAIAIAAGVAAPRPADAHLSIIRQGAESRGSAEAGDRHGTAVAAGDFNGDGYDDLAMGSSLENVGAIANAGMVIVEWGTAHGVTHVGAVAITEADAGGADQANADFGYALVTGDFNNDGYSDLAIGAPGSDAGSGNADAGELLIMNGSFSGLVPGIVLNQSDIGGGREVDDRFGFSLAVGDFNRDGFDDLAAGAPGEDAGAGVVFYMLGSSFGVPNGGDGWFKQSTLGGTDETDDSFGWSLAAGNLLGTSNDDLAVGAPYEGIGFGTFQGQVWVVRGASTGLSVSTPKVFSAGILDNSQASGNFGFALATGRFSSLAAGFTCLAIGEPGRDIGVMDRGGRVVVVEGASAGLDSSSALAIDQSDAGGFNNADDEFGAALSAGTFDEVSGTYDDLAVGSPGESFNGAYPDAGNFYVLHGGANGPTGAYGWANFNQGTCNEPSEAGDEFGESICFGRFDASNKGAFAVGAPGENNDAGMVHVIAPWRQLYGLASRQSLVYDCEENLVFSAKPFEQVWVASTTKTMTVLIAAERSQLPVGNPNRINLDDEIIIPDWVAWEIPGSQVPLVASERISLRDLMYTCLMLSGNDAAFAIANFIYGGSGASCATAFAAEMNARAAALGMNNTHFHNPAGLDNEPLGLNYELGEHYSTPEDMAKLSRAAMNNPLVAQIAGTSTYSMTRQYFVGNNTWEADPFEFNNFFFGILNNETQPATGIKGGGTPWALATGLFSAESNAGGTAIAGFYGLPLDDPRYVDDAARLLQLGVGQCNQLIDITPAGPYVQMFGDLSSILDQRAGGAGQWGPPPNPDQRASTFDLFRTSGQGATSADLTLRRTAEVDFPSNQTVVLGSAPFHRSEEIRIFNMGTTPVTFEVIKSWGGPAETITIVPCVYEIIPAYTSPTPLASATISLRNTTGQPISGQPAHVMIEEGYAFDLDAIGNPGGPVFTATIRRASPLVGDSFEFLFTGQDAVNGSTFDLVVHDPGALTGVGDPGGIGPGDAAAAPLRLLAASPNPFTTETRIGFALARAGTVGVKIYDVQGRLVRALDETRFDAGNASVAWDGREDDGRRVAPGVFFYRVNLDGRTAASGKLVTLSR